MAEKAYEEVKKYCSREKTIKDILSDENFKLLTDNNDNTEWKKRFEEYKKVNNRLKLPKVEIAESEDAERSHNNLSTGCTKVINKEFENAIKAIELWCKAK